MAQLITGIQQVGVGVADAGLAWQWYRKVFGLDVPVFDDEAEATLMKKYTGNEVHKRRAILAINMMGGGGFEVWQFKSRIPSAAAQPPDMGDYGINAVKIKSPDVEKAWQALNKNDEASISPIYELENGRKTFWVFDPWGNRFQVLNGNSWFTKNKQLTGGVCGVTIGVSNVDQSIPLYRDILGFKEVAFDHTGIFPDLEEGKTYRRAILYKPQKNDGAFSRLFGDIEVELVESKTGGAKKLFENRYWGDLGFIHVCFDVNDMDRLKSECENLGYPFTVDSADSFDMGEAAGRFSYIEDPDGTLIEFVQTHKVPVMKKWGWYINLQNRKHQRPLPNWMLRSMALNRVKD